MPEAVSDLNHELFRSFRAIHLMRSDLAPMLPDGLDPAAAQLLALLVKHGPARQNEMAEQTFLDPSTVSRRVSQLVEHKLVQRLADPLDGRAVRLAATDAGFALVGHVRQARDRITRDVLGEWEQDDVVGLAGLLRRFNDSVDGYRRRNQEQGEP